MTLRHPQPEPNHAPESLRSQWQANRMIRCQAFGIDVAKLPASHRIAMRSPHELVAVVSSRLGHDPHRHRDMSRQLASSLRQVRSDRSTLLIGSATAIEPWAVHAAGTFRTPLIRLDDTEKRDRVVIAIADRVDALYVRRQGKVASWLLQRASLSTTAAASTRIAIGPCTEDRGIVWELLRAGAIGRYLPAEEQTIEVGRARVCNEPTSTDWSDFFVHCTRAASGPWPGQTWHQYRDDLLLGDCSAASRDAIDALCRIVQKRRVIAGAITSAQTEPVVCFSGVPLPDLIARRTYRQHLHRWDYEPYGIAIRKHAAERAGLQPVIYGTAEDRQSIPTEDLYRFQSAGKTHDWTSEQELRIQGDLDLSRIDPGDIRIFTPDETSARQVSRWNTAQWPITIHTVAGQ